MSSRPQTTLLPPRPSAAKPVSRPDPKPDPKPDPALTRRTELVLREIDALPTLPSIAVRLLEMGSDETVNIKEVIRIIETDPTLTVRLLALCKRATTRTRVPITTVEMAVVMLGLEAVRSLVLSVQVLEWQAKMARPAAAPPTPQGDREPGTGTIPGFDRMGFWQHSVSVACAADLIAREHSGLGFHPEEAFVCGLLHDLGKLALNLVLPKAYARVIDLTAERAEGMERTERVIIGLDHTEAGARLAEMWGLPGLIRGAIAMHHGEAEESAEPGDEGGSSVQRRVAALVRVADALVRKLGLGWSGSCDGPGDLAALSRDAGLDPARVEGVTDRLYEAAGSRLRDLGLGDDPSQQLLVSSIMKANGRLAQLNQDLALTNERLRRTQDELTEARSMARLGQMTAGAAHEMNNPLAVISGRAQALLSRQKDERDKASAQAVVEAAQRLTHLIARLNRIATPPTPRPLPVDLPVLIGDAVGRAKARHAARLELSGVKAPLVGVKVYAPQGLPAWTLDRELATDALVEVLVNALEASPRSGIEVRAQTDGVDDRLVISVVDDGAGMNELALAHALDPFFSQKPAGRQAGLGLALAHRLVQLHGGDITLASVPGKGTTVTIGLPRARPDRAAPVRSSAAA